jgi:hypothetical protein
LDDDEYPSLNELASGPVSKFMTESISVVLGSMLENLSTVTLLKTLLANYVDMECRGADVLI